MPSGTMVTGRFAPGNLDVLLSRHVHLCRTDDYVVLLDLRRDKYLALSASQQEILETTVPGFPARDHDASHTHTIEDRDRLLEKLIQQGLLTRDPQRGKPAQAPILDEPSEHLLGDAAPTPSTVTPLRVAQFLRASAHAAMGLRWRTLERLVVRAADRKARTAGVHQFDRHTAAQAVSCYDYLRPLLFTSRDACLFDSLALLEYLSYWRVFPTWVIGVRTQPFGAHSWLQQGGLMLNDSPEHARKFTPIMAI